MSDAVCTCGALWPCDGPAWMGDHSPVAETIETWRPCGGPAHTGNAERPAADQCRDCEPRPCSTCGELSTPSQSCDCWIVLADLAPADVKALFARGGWSLGTDGRVEP